MGSPGYNFVSSGRERERGREMILPPSEGESILLPRLSWSLLWLQLHNAYISLMNILSRSCSHSGLVGPAGGECEWPVNQYRCSYMCACMCVQLCGRSYVCHAFTSSELHQANVPLTAS